ncbi:MAG: class IV adenylate cyclase [Planctomycetota bacterium]|nr:class IV adenylate cyclase [Planctomycetota bacterium]MDA1139256.1 class IV adenylate cyclase [Planctomycetota bacterium]
MARNIEIKARLPEGLNEVRSRSAALAAEPPTVLLQTDTFFNIPKGRLKLREFADGCAELIYYERPDSEGPKASSYVRSPCPSSSSMHEALTGALGVRGVVKKRRELFITEQTRIHLDEVEGLGTYLELEVVMRDDQTDAEGRAIANQLLKALGIQQDWLISGAYIDLLEAGAEE